MDYDAPASYIFALVAFGAALLSVISGVAVLVIYETGASHRDMNTLKVGLFVHGDAWFDIVQHMSRGRIVCLLLWLAGPSLCLAVATICLFLCKSDMGHSPIGGSWRCLWYSYRYRLLPNWEHSCQSHNNLGFLDPFNQRNPFDLCFHICGKTVSWQHLS